MTLKLKVDTWAMNRKQVRESRDWEVHLSTLDKDSKHGSMKRGKFSTLNKHSREHHSEIVAATCILLKNSKTSTKKNETTLNTAFVCFETGVGDTSMPSSVPFRFRLSCKLKIGCCIDQQLSSSTATLHRSTACIDHACPSTAILNRRGMNPTRIGTH